ncbi:MAG: hypothetical protein KGO02_18100 [Alphaproteobacteria bacterium]|nr:hypothetical protein [Alphaproteobacteria bacterium]
MLDEIKIFKTEIDSIIADIAQLKSKTLNNPEVEERICQSFITWSRLKARIESTGVQPAKVTQVDNLLEIAARNSGRRIQKAKFRDQLRKANKILTVIYLDAVRAQEPLGVQRILAEIPDLPDDLIPKGLVGWISKIKDFLTRYPFDQNVFVMIRYANQSSETLEKVTARIRAVGDADGRNFFPVVAKDHGITDNLDNPIACLLCCRYGVVVFDTVEEQPEFNPNVTYELGMMHLLQRECLILKSSSIKTMPADILQKIYKPFSSSGEAADKVEAWLRALSA